MEIEEHIQDRILRTISSKYKSVTTISGELKENRDRIQRHIKWLFKNKKLIRKNLKDIDSSKYKRGYTYKAKTSFEY